MIIEEKIVKMATSHSNNGAIGTSNNTSSADHSGNNMETNQFHPQHQLHPQHSQQQQNQYHENFRENDFTKKIVENSGKEFSITKPVHEETKFDNFELEPELYDEVIKCQRCQWTYIAPFSNFCITCLDECIRISVSEYGTIFICTLCEIEPEEYCDRSEINSHIENVHFAYDD